MAMAAFALTANTIGLTGMLSSSPRVLCVLLSVITCDCPTCANPDHLLGSTQKQNMKDKIHRGRQARGSQNGRSKLTEYDVLLIRDHLTDGCLSQAAIGRLFGVSHSVIRDIKHGKTWTHIWLSACAFPDNGNMTTVR